MRKYEWRQQDNNEIRPMARYTTRKLEHWEAVGCLRSMQNAMKTKKIKTTLGWSYTKISYRKKLSTTKRRKKDYCSENASVTIGFA